MDPKDEIEKKAKELQAIMAEYHQELGMLEKELFQVLSDYQKSLDQEKIEELKQQLNS